MIHCFLLIYFNNKPLHVSSRLAALRQEDQLCINSSWYSVMQYVDWLLQQSVNILHDTISTAVYTQLILLAMNSVTDDHSSNPDQKYARRREMQSTFGRIK
jgi:hypothetical protein